MSDITFKVELDHKEKRDGTRTVYIRMTQIRRLKRVHAGFSVAPEYWNPEKNEIRKTHPQWRQLNALLKSKTLELENEYLKESTKGHVITSETLARKVQKVVLGDNFFEYAETYIAQLPSAGTRRTQTSVITKLKEYRKQKPLYFDEVDYKFLVHFRTYLKRLGNAPNTIHKNLKIIRTIYNVAVNSGDYKPEIHAFASLKMKKQRSNRVKLDEQQIEQLYLYQVRPDLNDFHAKQAFLFSYYAQGMRVSDVLQLTWSKIKEDRLEYSAGKTGKFKSIKLRPRALEILAIYRLPGAKPADYVFPFLKGRKRERFTEEQWLTIISNATQVINQSLKNIASKTDLPPFSMHVARHSFAEMARQKTGDIYLVSEALDHSSVAVTMDYFAAAKKKENDDFSDKVYGT